MGSARSAARRRHQQHSRRSRRRLTAPVVGAVIAVLVGAVIPAGSPAATASATSAASTEAQRQTVALRQTEAQSFDALARRLGGQVGVAWVPLGGGASHRHGGLKTGVAWSTAKVPVAIAVVRRDHGRLTTSDAKTARAAITRSDNAAAMRLWGRLGSGSRAAAATEKVLRAGGDSHTDVPAKRLRAGFTPFGQARWALTDQARFAAELPCVSGSKPIRSLMTDVTPSQQWGIGRLPGDDAFKGGWGPGTDGRYLVRQFGIVRLADGTTVGLAIAARPADGTFSTGTENLDALASWARTHAHGVRGSHC